MKTTKTVAPLAATLITFASLAGGAMGQTLAATESKSFGGMNYTLNIYKHDPANTVKSPINNYGLAWTRFESTSLTTGENRLTVEYIFEEPVDVSMSFSSLDWAIIGNSGSNYAEFYETLNNFSGSPAVTIFDHFAPAGNDLTWSSGELHPILNGVFTGTETSGVNLEELSNGFDSATAVWSNVSSVQYDYVFNYSSHGGYGYVSDLAGVMHTINSLQGTVVPEPSSSLLIGLAGLGLLARRRR